MYDQAQSILYVTDKLKPTKGLDQDECMNSLMYRL